MEIYAFQFFTLLWMTLRVESSPVKDGIQLRMSGNTDNDDTRNIFLSFVISRVSVMLLLFFPSFVSS